MKRHLTRDVLSVENDSILANSALELAGLKRATSFTEAQKLYAKSEHPEEKELYLAQFEEVFSKWINRKGHSNRIARRLKYAPKCKYTEIAETKLYESIVQMLNYKGMRDISEFEVIKKSIIQSDAITNNTDLRDEIDKILSHKTEGEILFTVSHSQSYKPYIAITLGLNENNADEKIERLTEEIVRSIKKVKSSRLIDYYLEYPALAVANILGDDYLVILSMFERDKIKNAIIEQREKLHSSKNL